MTAPRRDDATIRGAVVLVVAIVIGLALLARSGTAGDDDTSPQSSSSSTQFDGSTSSTQAPINDGSSGSNGEPSGPLDPGDVTVVVLNGTPTGVDGAAGTNQAKIDAVGYTTLSSANATTKLETTTIYASADFRSDAEAIRDAIGLPDAAIETPPATPPGPGAERADVVVVIGGDYRAG